MDTSMQEQIRKKTEEIEKIIYSYLPEAEGYPATVLSAMNYTFHAGGKRLRPMLMYETYRLFGGSDHGLIDPFMAAIEMIHTYSLVHDDLPALDNDDYRRGKKTAHVIYGEAMAILAGDALLNYAFETACKAFRGDGTDLRTAKALSILAKRPGIFGMIGGQVADVEHTGKEMSYDTLMYIHENKTAALIECAMTIGAVLAGAGPAETDTVKSIAHDVGIAFQIRDDILDVIGTEEVLGKPVGSDEKNAKTTYVTFRGLEQADEDVHRLTESAVGAFDSLGRENPFLRSLLIELCSRQA